MVIFHSYISLPEGSQIHSMSEMMQLQGWIATSCCHPAILVCLEACPTIDVSTVSPSEPCSKPTWLTKELGDHLVWAKIPNGPLWETQRKTAGDASTGWFLKTGGIIAIYAIHIYNIYIYIHVVFKLVTSFVALLTGVLSWEDHPASGPGWVVTPLGACLLQRFIHISS